MTEGTMQSGDVIVRAPGEGRFYDCGHMQAVFKADGAETGSRYCVSEWWVEPNRVGVGLHSHDANEELFYVLEGTMTFRVGDRIIDAAAGSFLRVPAGVEHGFENRTSERAGVLNIFIPGDFEERMPEIVAWFAAHPEASAPIVEEDS
jgi:mannose-6-phosphate isomerase-like protein (cupin superfamily)